MSSTETSPPVGVKPPGTRELTLRAMIAAVVVAAVMGASYPYVVLKLGFGPNVSVVAAFLGYLSLGLIFRDFNRWENNIVQTAGTSAAQTAFMCVILAAFDFMAKQPGSHFTFAPRPFDSFLWLTCASVLGLLLAVPMRRHYIVEEKLTFADGVAAAETIVVLDGRGKDARAGALALGLATIASAIVWLLTTKYGGSILRDTVFPTMFGLTAATVGSGFSVSLLTLGSGMIVGNRINISMAIGGVLSWIIAPKLLYPGIIHSLHYSDVLLWVMWPGTGMLVAAGITALLLKYKTLVRTFTKLKGSSIDSGEFPLRWVGLGAAAATLALAIIERLRFGMPMWLTVASALLSAPLMLVGLRVLGETNWGPISQLTNLMQAIFAGLAPGNVKINLIASGTTGTIATQSEAIMQDYKAGDIIGSTPRFLTYSQLIAAPIGAAAVAFTYPLYKATYGIGGKGLSSPISVRIAGVADIVSHGISALPRYALLFLVIGAIVGILITLGETRWKWLPSATGLGIGMMIPGAYIFTMVLGGLALSAWQKLDRRGADKLGMPLASGLIAGEALMAIVVPVLIALHLISAR